MKDRDQTSPMRKTLQEAAGDLGGENLEGSGFELETPAEDFTAPVIPVETVAPAAQRGTQFQKASPAHVPAENHKP